MKRFEDERLLGLTLFTRHQEILGNSSLSRDQATELQRRARQAREEATHLRAAIRAKLQAWHKAHPPIPEDRWDALSEADRADLDRFIELRSDFAELEAFEERLAKTIRTMRQERTILAIESDSLARKLENRRS